MKKIFAGSILVLLILAVLAGSMVASAKVGKSNGNSSSEEQLSNDYTVPSDDAIIEYLKKTGKITENSTKEEVSKLIEQYKKNIKSYNKERDEEIIKNQMSKTKNKSDLDLYNFLLKDIRKDETIVKDFENSGVPEKTRSNVIKKGKVLVLLVDFGKDSYGEGPVHNQIPMPSSDDGYTFWTKNFDREHYRNLIFKKGGMDYDIGNGKTIHMDSMYDYFYNQSNSNYQIDGDVYGWFKVSHSGAYYGDDVPGSAAEKGTGSDGADMNSPGSPKDLVKDLVEATRTVVPYDQYDVLDPNDIDGDGDFNEPDGIVDSLVIIFAGKGEATGGTPDTIWPHSSRLLFPVQAGNETKVSNYTIQEENSAVGLLCHEYTHALGLPDDYDIKYSGNGDPVGDYSLMSSGSHLGLPSMTKPSGISPWGRMMLSNKYGTPWIYMQEVNINDLNADGMKYRIDPSSVPEADIQAIKVNLPDYSSSWGYKKQHYYILEWRTFDNVDEGLKYSYTTENKEKLLKRMFQHERGLLVWYRNTAYTDNCTGEHPGYCKLGIVDAHPEAILAGETNEPLYSSVQLNDAAFGLWDVPSKVFFKKGVKIQAPSRPANPVFDDSQIYWTNDAPHSGLKLKTYGLSVEVLSDSSREGSGYVKIMKK